MFKVKVLAESGWIYTYEVSEKDCEGDKQKAEFIGSRDHFLRVFFNELADSETMKKVLEVIQEG